MKFVHLQWQVQKNIRLEEAIQDMRYSVRIKMVRRPVLTHKAITKS